MKLIARSTFQIFLLLLVFNKSVNAQHFNHLKYVNPFIGTAKSNVATNWGSDGGTYPGAVVPSGFVQLSPETRTFGTRGYHFQDTEIYYFSCFEHMSGFPEGSAGNFYIMPVADTAGFEGGKYGRKFLHQDEIATPGYYKVSFADNRSSVEATTTLRTGFFRFYFLQKTSAQIFIADSSLKKTASKTVLQFRDNNTVINFSRAFSAQKKLKNGWLFTFDNHSNPNTVEVKLSRSAVSMANAQNNIDKEIGRNTFEQVRSQAASKWISKLSVVDIYDLDENNKTVFYTALYHSLLIPWVVDDADGRYKGADHKIHQKTGAYQYGAFSPWDTFRSLHPLLTLLYPNKQKDVLLSMLDIFKQSGHLPTESMTGNHAIPIFVDAYLKGITGIDKNLAYTAMKKSIVDAPFIQPDMEIYHNLGYIPFTRSESVTRTVEYAYDDWCLSQFAKKIIHNDADYKLLNQRGNNYSNLFNVDELLLLPRDKAVFKNNPGMSGYKEGDKWVYSYFVPHNARDLINLMGGNEQFVNRLDSVLFNNVVLFDNETVFHLPYFFNAAGRPELTQKWCRQIMTNRFGATPGGLPGNDDLGSTSSWYVLSAMGIYPVCPGRPVYAVGAPLFKSVILHLQNGKKFVIEAENSGLENNYVQSLSINGHEWQQLTLPHSTLLKGGNMRFTMGTNPNNWPHNANPANLSETKNHAVFSTINFEVSKKIVQPNQPFTVYFKLKNQGATGVKTNTLFVNGEKYASKNSMVPTNTVKTDSLTIRLYPVGKVMLKLNDQEPVQIEVQQSGKLQPALISNLTAKPLVHLGGQQQLKFNIQNVNGKTQTFVVPVMINQKLLFSDTIKLAAGAKKEISHTFNCLSNGFQTIEIDGSSVLFKVYGTNLETLVLHLSALKIAGDGKFHDQSGFNNIIKIMSSNKLLVNEAFSFDDTHYVEAENAASLDVLDTTITMMVWIKPTGSEKQLVDVFTKGDNHVLQISNNKTLTFFAGGWGRGDCTANLPANWRNTWHHIAGVCQGSKLMLYIDGDLAATTITENTVNLSGGNKWVLGRNEEFPSERFFYGQIDEAKIFGAALSGDEIKSIFQNKNR